MHVEDEFHVIFICPQFDTLRENCLSPGKVIINQSFSDSWKKQPQILLGKRVYTSTKFWKLKRQSTVDKLLNVNKILYCDNYNVWCKVCDLYCGPLAFIYIINSSEGFLHW